MNEALVFLLLFAAVACGWWLGRRSLSGVSDSASGPPSQYYRGLNYLLDGRPDGAVDQFISALEVNSETLETHIALGNVLRRRGEVDRAIRIHQNLLARPNLPRSQMHIAHLELARDYISAGLLDRAETLLLDLVAESDEQRDVSRQYLVEIYRSESEWQRAIDEAQALLPKRSLLRGEPPSSQLSGQPMAIQLAHFYCEFAVEQAQEGKLEEARRLLQNALQSDPACARASLELGRFEGAAGNHRLAIDALTRVVEEHAEFLPEAIPALRECYAALGEEQALSTYLRRCLDEHPSTPLMIAVADDIHRDEGNAAAHKFLAERLAQGPSLRGLLRLIRIQQEEKQGVPGDSLSMLSILLHRLIEVRPAYRCDHCGFSARHLLWFCPGCKYWGTFRTIRTAETE
ncbi:lipopolysaccharide assembly protein LapB [Congregibacter variabilis]|uniref:Lipopolysaccharide assembly protein B n=1 Tax=Congregibacter variabilis TaxID=3081200 RepID=A0ABZ0I739_9GAMM|nr:lipopolysaccharide assembly protein LapB [Congregibacter sp. IMCC43200]